MAVRDWLVAEIDKELQSATAYDDTEEPWLEETLASVLGDSGLSDPSIELLIEAAEAPPAAQEYRSEVVAEVPSVASRREALGISIGDAASDLGIGAAGYEALETTPLRWLNLDPRRAAAYVGRLGISPGLFVRWLATQLPQGSRFAWGYRPGAVLDHPVEATDAVGDRERLINWGHALLSTGAHPRIGGDVRELFGHLWSAAVSEARSRQIAQAAHARIIGTDFRYELAPSVARAALVALPTSRGVGYPAFQFDEHGDPIPVVTEINALLDAGTDPWGVADWWLTKDETIGVRPVDLIGAERGWDDRLRRAARALIESD